jgi:hypothetical protein
LNARYYNPTQSQFLTEDPVFWGQQNLQDPQSFNTYSYAEGNPITGSDPSGKCPWCLVGAAGVFGFGAGIANQGFNDYQSGDFSRRSAGQNLATYGLAGVGGAVIAAGALM